MRPSVYHSSSIFVIRTLHIIHNIKIKIREREREMMRSFSAVDGESKVSRVSTSFLFQCRRSKLNKTTRGDHHHHRHHHHHTKNGGTIIIKCKKNNVHDVKDNTLLRRKRRMIVVANASSTSSSSSSSSKEKFEKLRDMLDAVSEALDCSGNLQIELDEANGEIERLELKVKERDGLLVIVRGLEIELADSYTPKEVESLLLSLKKEREDELEALKKELVETKSLREKVTQMYNLEKEKENAKKEALENGEKLYKAELNLESLKQESSMQSMELQGKMENVEKEASKLKGEIRKLETRMVDMVDAEETDKEIELLKIQLENEKAKSETLSVLKNALKEMTLERDEVRKMLREVEASMAEMTENQEVAQIIREKNILSVKSQVDEFSLKQSNSKQSAEQQNDEKRNSSKTLTKAETDKLWVDNCIEKQYCEVEKEGKEEDKGEKVPFERYSADEFTVNRKVVSAAENVCNPAEFLTPKTAFVRIPGQFTLRKFAFDSPSKRRASVPATAFKRTGEFELRRFIFTSDVVDVVTSVENVVVTRGGGFKRTPGSFTMRKFNFIDNDDSINEEDNEESYTTKMFTF